MTGSGQRCDGSETGIPFPPVSDPTRFLGDRMRQWRRARNYPLKRVAYDLGVSVSVVDQWENAERFPSRQNLIKIAQYMSMPLCAFFNSCSVECLMRVKDAAGDHIG